MARPFVRHNRSWDQSGIRSKLYGRKWQEARARFLQARPWCVRCEAAGEMEPATVVDHITPHRGDLDLFWNRANWQPLCARHHNADKAAEEINGYSDRLDDDGWPADPAHPANSGMKPISGKARPLGLKQLKVPVLLVVGPPGAGKTTWCKDRMQAGDLLIDQDEIAARMYGTIRQRSPLLVPLLRERNRMLMEAAERESGCVFLTMLLPLKAERDWWREQLGSVKVVMIPTPAAICIERIQADRTRRQSAANECEAVKRWWRTAQLDSADEMVIDTGGGSEAQK